MAVKTHVYDWIMVGPLFQPLHAMLEGQYDALLAAADLFRRTHSRVGFPRPPILHIAIKPEARDMTAEQIVEYLLSDHEADFRQMREIAIRAKQREDIITHDLLSREWPRGPVVAMDSLLQNGRHPIQPIKAISPRDRAVAFSLGSLMS